MSMDPTPAGDAGRRGSATGDFKSAPAVAALNKRASADKPIAVSNSGSRPGSALARGTATGAPTDINPKRASGTTIAAAAAADGVNPKRASATRVPTTDTKLSAAAAAAAAAAAGATPATSVVEATQKIETPEERAIREAKEKEDDEKLFPPGFAYDDHKSPDLVHNVWPYELKSDYVKLHASFGFPCEKRYNLHYLGFGEIVYAAGNTVQTVDLLTNAKRVLLGRGKATNAGVAAVAVHPSGKYFAVAERGINPNILIYAYPTLEIIRILRKGTERSYSDLQFSPTGGGDKLASVGADPDYSLTVWDWARERVLLRTKAFSQDVYRVAFSPHEGRLITSGTGHIRFWKMASTFTGLKLQGAIGKFGNVELSDICSFAELPNGKVISGTESGFLLMWDGNFIQFQISKRGGAPCHDGNIELIHLEMEDDISRAGNARPPSSVDLKSDAKVGGADSKDSKAVAAPNMATLFKEKDTKMVLVTAGSDGYVKFWKFDKLEFAETADEDPLYEMEPIHEKKIGNGVKIKAMLKGDNHWLIQDEHGALYRLWYPALNVEKVWDVHAGDITGLASAPNAHVAVTCGVDSSVRCWDVLGAKNLYTQRYSAPARSLVWAPATVDEESRMVFVGFEDGVVRVLLRYADSFSLLYAFKPHKKPVSDMSISPDGTMLATAATDGTLFFIQLAKKGETITGQKAGKSYNPLGFVKLPAPASSLQWDKTSTYLLLACGPDVYQYQKPNPNDYKQIAESRDTFEITLPVKKFRIDVKRTLRRRKTSTRVRITIEPDASDEERARIEEEEKRRDDAEEKERQRRHAEVVAKRAPDLVSCVLYGQSSGDSKAGNDSFWVTLDGGGTAQEPHARPGSRYETLYECSFSTANAAGVGAPIRSVPVGRDMGTVTYLGYSASGKYLLIGTRNGGVQMRPVHDIMYFMYTRAHDGERGSINRVSTSFDDRILLSVGRDGNFFSFLVDATAALVNADRSWATKAAEKAAARQQARLEGGLDASGAPAVPGQEEEEDEEALHAADSMEYGPNGLLHMDEDPEWIAAMANVGSSNSSTAAAADSKSSATTAGAPDEAEHKRKLDAQKAKLAEEAAKHVEEVVVRIPKVRGASAAPPTPTTTIPRPAGVDETIGPKGTALLTGEGADITDPSTYSIEDEKLKQEEDERLRSADDKKREVRLQIEKMRKQFTELLTQNNALEKGQQLPREAFELDPKLREQLELEAQKKIEDVKAELAWISEKHSIALQKLRAKFLDHVLVEHITLKSFRAPVTSVSCFRTPELPPFLTDAIEEVHKVLTADENRRREQADRAAALLARDPNNAKGDDSDDEDKRKEEEDEAAAAAAEADSKQLTTLGAKTLKGKQHASPAHMKFGSVTAAHKYKSHGNKALSGEPEQRKKNRDERKQDLERLRALQPNPDALDPKDLKAVEDAQHQMGDYKLKSSDQYRVPEDQRVNMEKKRTQMVMLQESVQLIRMRFNERFLALRDLKERVVRYIQRDNARLAEINKRLGIDERLWTPEIDPSEFPEHRDLYTQADLVEFEKERERERQKLAQKDRGGFLATFDITATADIKQRGGDRKDATGADDFSGSVYGNAWDGRPLPPGAKRGAGTGEPDRIDAHYRRLEGNAAKSEMERAEETVARRLLEHERATLLDKIDFAVWTFDDAVSKLRAEKCRADVDLKTTDLKLLTLYQELNVLREFQDRETRFFHQLQKARDQKNLIRKDMSEVSKMLEHKKDELGQLNEKKKQNEQDFNDAVGDKKEIYNPLLKIFNKSVKKKKRRQRAEEGADDDSDSDEKGGHSGDDNDDDDEDGGGGGGAAGGDDEEDADAPPAGCDDKTHQAVLDLRTRRLEIDDAIFEVDKVHADFALVLEKHHAKEALIDKELARTEREIEELQSEKQRALNAIEVIIPLKLSQMKCLVDGKLPRDISSSLIFTSTGLNRLHTRISELRSQQEALTKKLRAMQLDEKKKQKEVKRTRGWIEEEKNKCKEVQMLKFGQIVDLAILEKVQVDEGAKDLKDKLKALENTSVSELSHWDQKIAAAKDQLARVCQVNTQYLEKVAELTEQQYSLEDQLNTTTKNVHVTDSSPVDEKSESERAQLLQLVQIQEKEIDALKAEIHVLRRKGGQIYTPHS